VSPAAASSGEPAIFAIEAPPPAGWQRIGQAWSCLSNVVVLCWLFGGSWFYARLGERWTITYFAVCFLPFVVERFLPRLARRATFFRDRVELEGFPWLFGVKKGRFAWDEIGAYRDGSEDYVQLELKNARFFQRRWAMPTPSESARVSLLDLLNRVGVSRAEPGRRSVRVPLRQSALRAIPTYDQVRVVDPVARAVGAPFVEKCFERLPQAWLADKAVGWTANVHFHFPDHPGWTVQVADGRCTVELGLKGEPSCVVEMNVFAWRDLVLGGLTADQALLEGRIEATNPDDLARFRTAFDLVKLGRAVFREDDPLVCLALAVATVVGFVSAIAVAAASGWNGANPVSFGVPFFVAFFVTLLLFAFVTRKLKARRRSSGARPV
jgi:hypothetical protein